MLASGRPAAAPARDVRLIPDSGRHAPASECPANEEIAAKLFLSPRTVDMHVSRILDRLTCRTRTEAAGKAAELGIE